VQFVLSGLPEQVERLVGRLGRMGVSLSVADGDGLHAFHIHTNEPARVLEAARAAGTLIGESVVPLGVPVIAGLVAVSAGPGVIAALGALGAVVVDGGGEPTHRDLARAIRRAPGSGGVVVLVDRAASLAAAERAVADGRRATRIVAAGSVPAALAAATTYDPALDLDTNVALMRAAAAACAAGEVTGAPSTSPPGGVGSRPWVGTRDGSTVSVATDPATAALDLVQELLDGTTSAGAITIVLGDGAAPATDPVVAALRRAHPDLELHPVAGGQARSRYLIGVG
jgi:dihydroxyacetone kinase-like predicted kinase